MTDRVSRENHGSSLFTVPIKTRPVRIGPKCQSSVLLLASLFHLASIAYPLLSRTLLAPRSCELRIIPTFHRLVPPRARDHGKFFDPRATSGSEYRNKLDGTKGAIGRIGTVPFPILPSERDVAAPESAGSAKAALHARGGLFA